MAELFTLVIASTNEGKLLELRSLFRDIPVQLVSVASVVGDRPAPCEDGATFQDNAVIKARAACRATGLHALADDSGLEVKALDGRPGVRSARFASERATDAENNAALLRELEDIPDDERIARFRCVLALASPWDRDKVETVEGSVEGLIARAPRGSGGFGYDPLFIVPSLGGRAMAELGEDEKNEVSHRARAAIAMRAVLLRTVERHLAEADRAIR
jgi:XTP/dITP diphosphohydrolase